MPGGFPVGHQWRVDVRNDHLQYAITWYALALALLVIYVLSQRRPDQGQHAAEDLCQIYHTPGRRRVLSRCR